MIIHLTHEKMICHLAAGSGGGDTFIVRLLSPWPPDGDGRGYFLLPCLVLYLHLSHPAAYLGLFTVISRDAVRVCEF